MHTQKFTFTEEAMREIQELQGMVRLSNIVQLIRHALRFLQWAVEETRKGGTLCLKKDEVVYEIIPFWKADGPAEPEIQTFLIQ